jgi:DNA polymerase V
MHISLLGKAGSFALRLIPLFLERVSAGFPSPAQDLCIQHPAATFFVRVSGDSMIEAGIFPGDILVVDRSLRASHGDVVIAVLDGEFTVKELALHPAPMLLPRNRAYAPITLGNDSELEIFGVVTRSIRDIRGQR